jgi:AcrR family transcriptional regulator
MRDQILHAAVTVLVQRGLNGWTVDEVAKEAGCAKGLVNYHHRSKHDLLIRVAERLRDERWTRRIEACRTKQPLDRLWQTLMEEVRSGRFAAWVSLIGSAPDIRAASHAGADRQGDLATTLGQSLELGPVLRGKEGLIAAALDGLQIALLQGEPPTRLEEAYHRFWLTLLDM